MRGSIFSMEFFISLAFAMAMAWLMLTYVNDQLDSTGYFSEFYVKDLSILADVTVSGPGEVTVLYDNLKSLPMEFVINKEVSIRAGDDFSVERSRSFGVPEGITTTQYSGSPDFLAFSKRQNSFLVAEATGFHSVCKDVPRTRGLNYHVVAEESLRPVIIGGLQEAINPAFRESAPQPKDQDEASIIFEIIDDEEFKIEHAGDKESEYLACVIKSQLSAFTNEEIVVDAVSMEEGTFKVYVNMDAKVLGQSLGRAVVVYAR